MRELRVGSAHDVALELLPVVVEIADLVAVGADRDQAFQAFDVTECFLELCDMLIQIVLEGDHADAGLHPGEELGRMKWFCNIVIRAGIKAFYDAGFVFKRGEKNQVGGRAGADGAKPAADLHAGHSRHDPVENQELRGIGHLKPFPYGGAVFVRLNFEPPLLEVGFKNEARCDFVIRDQDLHGPPEKYDGRILHGSGRTANGNSQTSGGNGCRVIPSSLK